MSNKESIHLRKRKLATGNTSLYLDVYRNGVRSYEYLKLYLIPEKTRDDKEVNRETLKLAEAIKAKRLVELHNKEYGFSVKRNNVRFFEFFTTLIDNDNNGRRRSTGCAAGWASTLLFLRQYEKREITFADIDTAWIMGFRQYLDTKAKRLRGKDEPISQNSKSVYLSKLRAAITAALNKGIIKEDPFIGVRGFSREDAEREYLTIEELRQLIQLPCEYEVVGRAFVFSCLTGLRISDVRKLKWEEVYQQGEFTRIKFRQKKTKGLEYLDVNAQAVEMMGKRQDDDKNVFVIEK